MDKSRKIISDLMILLGYSMGALSIISYIEMDNIDSFKRKIQAALDHLEIGAQRVLKELDDEGS